MEKQTKFLISRKDGEINFHKTNLLYSLFSLKNEVRENTHLNDKLLAFSDDTVYGFGTSAYAETPQRFLIFVLEQIYAYRFIYRFQKLNLLLTPEFLYRGDIQILKKAAEYLSYEPPEITINELKFSEKQLDEIVLSIVQNEDLFWKKSDNNKETAYINLKKFSKYFENINFDII